MINQFFVRQKLQHFYISELFDFVTEFEKDKLLLWNYEDILNEWISRVPTYSQTKKIQSVSLATFNENKNVEKLN